jgi:adenylate cyclase class IV
MLGGLMTLGYQLGAIITRFSDVYECENVYIKSDYVDVLRRRFTQVESFDRDVCEKTAKALGLDGTYSPNSYIELLQVNINRIINRIIGTPRRGQGVPNGLLDV